MGAAVLLRPRLAVPVVGVAHGLLTVVAFVETVRHESPAAVVGPAEVRAVEVVDLEDGVRAEGPADGLQCGVDVRVAAAVGEAGLGLTGGHHLKQPIANAHAGLQPIHG